MKYTTSCEMFNKPHEADKGKKARNLSAVTFLIQFNFLTETLGTREFLFPKLKCLVW